MTFGELVAFAQAFDSDRNSAYADTLYEPMVNDAIAEFWERRRWPFHFTEIAITTTAPYSRGSLTATKNSTNVFGSSSATWVTTWPRGIFYRKNSDYIVTSWKQSGSRWEGTLDYAFATSTTTSSYEFTFPIYELDSGIEAIRRPEDGSWIGPAGHMSYTEWLGRRINSQWSSWLRDFAVVQGDSYSGTKLYLYPAPADVRLIRMQAKRKVPVGRIYDTGEATVTFSGSAMTGSGTRWKEAGRSLVGEIVEFPSMVNGRWIQGIVKSVTNNTTAALSGTWRGQTQTTQPYRISTRLRLPDAAFYPLRSMIQSKVCEIRRDYEGLSFFKSQFEKQCGELACALEGSDAVIEMKPSDAQVEDLRYYPKAVIMTNG